VIAGFMLSIIVICAILIGVRRKMKKTEV
jgi:hypothetical protein